MRGEYYVLKNYLRRQAELCSPAEDDKLYYISDHRDTRFSEAEARRYVLEFAIIERRFIDRIHLEEEYVLVERLEDKEDLVVVLASKSMHKALSSGDGVIVTPSLKSTINMFGKTYNIVHSQDIIATVERDVEVTGRKNRGTYGTY